MPEILEVELFRRASAAVVGRRVMSVVAEDPIVVPTPEFVRSLVGGRVTEVGRHGKTMFVVVRRGRHEDSIDVHFGMSGRVIVDGRSPIEELAYGASDDTRWHRFAMTFDRGSLVLSDPRRFARVTPSDDRPPLGPDVWLVDLRTFRRRLAGRRSAVKAVLLDQSVVAGLGNMLVDEILMAAGVDPRRPIDSLDDRTIADVHWHLRRVLDRCWKRGGSHAGDLSAELRRPGASCPRDGAPLHRAVVGGRTTFWCPNHQD
jgi:formamidopyrimidine-DNA glycosylase